jgi:hypothetical protein
MPGVNFAGGSFVNSDFEAVLQLVPAKAKKKHKNKKDSFLRC